jgi:hypothetical protein
MKICPHSLRLLLTGHDVRTVDYRGWKSLTNGALLQAAEDTGFDVVLTADKNMPHQQNIRDRKLAVLILGANEREVIAKHLPEVISAISAAHPGTFFVVELGP